MGLRENQIERFSANIELIPFSDCHYWTGELNGCGYGVFDRRRAHRIAYELAKGPIPLLFGRPAALLHSCDNPMCVNAAHLRPGTHAENMKDAQERKRFPLGERHHSAKMTDAQRAELMEAIMRGERASQLAARFGIAKSRVSTLRHGRVGINHPASHLRATGRSDRRVSDDAAKDIYRRAVSGEQSKTLAAEYGVKPSFVADIKRGATYARVTGHRR